MPLLRNIGTLAVCPLEGGRGTIHLARDAALAWEGGVITWVGAEAELPEPYRHLDAIDARRRLVVPGLVDCHTHLAFGGWRADEFVQRVRGRSYVEIAAAGGGIASTVRQTRAASEDDLLARTEAFVD